MAAIQRPQFSEQSEVQQTGEKCKALRGWQLAQIQWLMEHLGDRILSDTPATLQTASCSLPSTLITVLRESELFPFSP
jgi:hypothetical protein